MIVSWLRTFSLGLLFKKPLFGGGVAWVGEESISHFCEVFEELSVNVRDLQERTIGELPVMEVRLVRGQF